MKQKLSLYIFLVILVFSCKNQNSSKISKISPGAIEFDYGNVKLLDSPFYQAMQTNTNWLLELKPDRLLYRCRVSAGLTPKDSSYSGWEERFSGHMLGHYLSACAMMTANGDERFRELMEYVIA
ncbi:MAG: glycoside hydrolase family 127 protein, partial [Bacteroidales bacterium]|nr:glycoside hydrolase family 127 protein [Bacteroidales bacterium]